MINSLTELEIALYNLDYVRSTLNSPMAPGYSLQATREYKQALKESMKKISDEIEEYLVITRPCKE